MNPAKSSKKISGMNEFAWVAAVILCAFGVALCTKASLGLSMVAAPGYIIHLFMRDIFPWYSQGTSEYIWQGIQLVLLCCIIRRFRPKFLLCFVTAVISGYMIDFWLFCLGGGDAYAALPARIFAFAGGSLIIAFAIALFFRTDLPLQVCELVPSEIARTFNLDLSRVKLGYDILMLTISVVLTFTLKRYNGIGIGTVIVTFVNAPLISLFGKFLDRYFVFDARFPKFTNKLK